MCRERFGPYGSSARERKNGSPARWLTVTDNAPQYLRGTSRKRRCSARCFRPQCAFACSSAFRVASSRISRGAPGCSR